MRSPAALRVYIRCMVAVCFSISSLILFLGVARSLLKFNGASNLLSRVHRLGHSCSGIEIDGCDVRFVL